MPSLVQEMFQTDDWLSDGELENTYTAKMGLTTAFGAAAFGVGTSIASSIPVSNLGVTSKCSI